MRVRSAIVLVLAGGWIAAYGGEVWTLEQAIRCALTNSPDARLAAERIRMADAALNEAAAAFWPRLQFNSSYTRTDNPMQVFGSILNQRAYPGPSLDFNDVPDTDNWNARGQLTMPLYTAGRNRAMQQAARANRSASKWDAESVQNQLGFEVARAYYSATKSREFVQAANAAAQAYEGHVDLARKRNAAGSLLKTELLDLEVRMAQSREDLVRARNAEALSLSALRNLLGVEDPGFAIATEQPPSLSIPTDHRSDRAELGAARERERAAREEVKSARAGYFPRLSAFGSLDYDYGWKFDHGGGSYTAGGLLQWDIWDGKLTRAKVQQAQTGVATAQEQARKLRLGIELETERAQLELASATEALSVTHLVVDQAAESAALTRVRFELGQALANQVMDAESALLGARVRRAQAEADRQIAIAALRAALGLPQLPK